MNIVTNNRERVQLQVIAYVVVWVFITIFSGKFIQLLYDTGGRFTFWAETTISLIVGYLLLNSLATRYELARESDEYERKRQKEIDKLVSEDDN